VLDRLTDGFPCPQACGPIKSFKRLITPANKPQGFGFAEFEEPDAALRAMALLQGVELPALEDGCANKSLLVRPNLFLCDRFTPMSDTSLDKGRREDQAVLGCLLGATYEN
jgi:RNA recognition motif-containing protein